VVEGPDQPLDPAAVRVVGGRMAGATGWMRLLAVLSILGGCVVAIYSLLSLVGATVLTQFEGGAEPAGIFTIFGAIGLVLAGVGVWLGVVLWQSASGFASARLLGKPKELDRALAHLRLYFVISGIIALIGLVVGIMVAFLVPMSQETLAGI
jgi:hypothetical protein